MSCSKLGRRLHCWTILGATRSGRPAPVATATAAGTGSSTGNSGHADIRSEDRSQCTLRQTDGVVAGGYARMGASPAPIVGPYLSGDHGRFHRLVRRAGQSRRATGRSTRSISTTNWRGRRRRRHAAGRRHVRGRGVRLHLQAGHADADRLQPGDDTFPRRRDAPIARRCCCRSAAFRLRGSWRTPASRFRMLPAISAM